MSILYINPLPQDIRLIVLDENKEVLFEVGKPKNNDEFSFFPELLVETVRKYKIDEIWCVVGPGPFTLMRIVTLAVNSVTYVHGIKLKSCNFFDLVTTGHTPIIEANAREYIILHKESNSTEYVQKGLLTAGVYKGIISKIEFTDGISFIEYREDIANFWNIFGQREPERQISPIYFKPPHIICSKKTLSHS